VKVEPSFGSEGAFGQTTITPTADWLEQLCGWVRRPPGELGPLVWPVVLMPQRIGSAFAFPADARTVSQRVRWDAAFPAGPLELRARATWVAARSPGSEVAVVTTASSSGTIVADNLVVVRTTRALPAWGGGHVPLAPEMAGERRRLSFALSEHDVAAFAELSGVHEPIHEDTSYAWGLGLANVLVQELTLLLIVMQVAGAPSPGSVEMWFPDPVPVGSLLTLWQGADAWTVLLAATKRPVAAGRIEGAHRPNGRCG
jgi:hypothetical protein